MTREEEIKQAAKNRADQYEHPVDWNNCYHHYIQGAKWADQHPRKGLWDAEKVCKWISERIGIDQKIETNSNGEPLADSYIAYCIARQNAADTMIKDLRKAMEN